MRGISSVASVTLHGVLAAAVLFGTVRTGRSNPPPIRTVTVVFQPNRTATPDDGIRVSVPTAPIFDGIDMGSIPAPSTTLPGLPPAGPVFPAYAPSGPTSAGTSGDPWTRSIGEEGPEVLTGPTPAYPDLLRQAGIQGQVVLEAVVDSTGRVLGESIVVVSASNPAFVAPARQALARTLFRPARVGGKAVRMRVRLPFEFTLRSGMARER
jgi:protein TonB